MAGRNNQEGSQNDRELEPYTSLVGLWRDLFIDDEYDRFVHHPFDDSAKGRELDDYQETPVPENFRAGTAT